MSGNPRNERNFAAVCLVAAVIGWGMSAVGQEGGSPPNPPAGEAPPLPEGLPASLAGFSDKGVFGMYRVNVRFAELHVDWQPDGSFRAETVTFVDESPYTLVEMVIEPDADGRFDTIVLDTPQGPFNIKRDGAKATITHKDQSETVTLRPGTMLFENYTPSLFSMAIRGYDRARGGPQPTSMFIIPFVVSDKPVVEFIDVVKVEAGPREYSFNRYLFKVGDVGVTLWADDADRIQVAYSANQSLWYVREGMELVRANLASDLQPSRADQGVRKLDRQAATMRDGVKLATDVYLPGGDGPFPTLLLRTPFGTTALGDDAEYFAKRGYAVAIQHCRGRGGSEGAWTPFVNEAEDGFDAVGWLASQPWCNGRVGMFGHAYSAWTQWAAACAKPANLVAIAPSFAIAGPRTYLYSPGGAFNMRSALYWADVFSSDVEADLDGMPLAPHMDKLDRFDSFRSLPVIDLDKAVLGAENQIWRSWLAEPFGEPGDDASAAIAGIEALEIPVLHVVGGLDPERDTAMRLYNRSAAGAKGFDKLVIGPWRRPPLTDNLTVGRDYSVSGAVDLHRLYLRWFEHWLKGVDNAIEGEPPVRYFAEGFNVWIDAPAYPPPDVRSDSWFLDSDSDAASSNGDGRLVRDASMINAPHDRMTYDPAKPTPAPNFYIPKPPRHTVELTPVYDLVESIMSRVRFETDTLLVRRDILVYAAEQPKEPVTIAGRVTGVIHASSDAPDTDWIVRLVEVDWNGNGRTLAETATRARYRKSVSKTAFLSPDEAFEYRFELPHVATTIMTNEHLRLEVCSAAYPTRSRNLNTAADNERSTEHKPAMQTVFHDTAHPSHIILPIIDNPQQQEMKAAESSIARSRSETKAPKSGE